MESATTVGAVDLPAVLGRLDVAGWASMGTPEGSRASVTRVAVCMGVDTGWMLVGIRVTDGAGSGAWLNQAKALLSQAKARLNQAKALLSQAKAWLNQAVDSVSAANSMTSASDSGTDPI